MDRALWLLIVLQLRGWLRYFVRSLTTLKGALLGMLGLTFLAFWLISVFYSHATADTGLDPHHVPRYGPSMLLFYCVINFLSSPGERAVYFNPAEVNLLFPAAFGRRQLLAYKILSGFLVGLPSCLLLSGVARGVSPSFLSVFLGMLLLVVFLQLFTMGMNLLAVSVGARLYSRGRKLVFAGCVGVALAVAWEASRQPPDGTLGAWLSRADQAEVWQTLTLPLSWFFQAMRATRLWPDLVRNAGLALLVDLCLLGVVFALDAHYLEAAASASARVYDRLQRRRAGRVPAARGGQVRFSPPGFPRLGGVGPVFWRQLVTSLRQPVRWLVVLLMFALIVGSSLATTSRATVEYGAAQPPAAWLTCLVLVSGAVFATALLPFDFRGDLDHLALLKTLPIAPWRLAFGQLLTPVLIVTLLQWAVLGGVYLLGLARAPGAEAWGARPLLLRPDVVLLVCGLYALPLNFLLFGLESLLFLLFPTRVAVNNPGDFQAIGRGVLFTIAKGVVLLFVAAGAGMVGFVVGSFFPLVGVAGGWVFVALCAAPLVPLTGWAFTLFDVGRDTPP